MKITDLALTDLKSFIQIRRQSLTNAALRAVSTLLSSVVYQTFILHQPIDQISKLTRPKLTFKDEIFVISTFIFQDSCVYITFIHRVLQTFIADKKVMFS